MALNCRYIPNFTAYCTECDCMNRAEVCQEEQAQTHRQDTNLKEETSKWKIVQFLFIWISFFSVVWETNNVFSLHLLLWYTVLMKASFILTPLPWLSDVQKHVNIFICLIALWRNSFNSGEQNAGRTVWESFTHPSSAHTPQPFIAATAPNLCNWT